MIKCKSRKKYLLETTAIFSVFKYECVIIGKAHCDNIALNCCETRLKGSQENGKTLVCDKREKAISFELCRDPYLTLIFSGLCKNICLMESGVGYFKQNYCHACHARFAVFFPLLILLRRFTNIIIATNRILQPFTQAVYHPCFFGQ